MKGAEDLLQAKRWKGESEVSMGENRKIDKGVQSREIEKAQGMHPVWSEFDIKAEFFFFFLPLFQVIRGEIEISKNLKLRSEWIESKDIEKAQTKQLKYKVVKFEQRKYFFALLQANGRDWAR